MLDQDNLQFAEDLLLAPTDLDAANLSDLLSRLRDVDGCDFADLYFQYAKQESWSLDEGVVKTGSFAIDQGCGMRAVAGEKTAFAYSEDLSLDALKRTANVVDAIGRRGQNVDKLERFTTPKVTPLYSALDPIVQRQDQDKVALLQHADAVARAADTRVKEVMANVSSVFEVVLIVTSDGRMVPDVRPLVRFNVSVIVEQDGRRERGSMGGGGRLADRHH